MLSRDRSGFKRVAGQLITGNKVRDLLVKNNLKSPSKFDTILL